MLGNTMKITRRATHAGMAIYFPAVLLSPDFSKHHNDCALYKNVTACARVHDLSGEKSELLVPEVMPLDTAQFTAS